MRKIIVISDSFKGTLSSSQIARIASSSIHHFYPDCCVVELPVADGGEGTVDCFLKATGGQKVVIETTGPWDEPVQAVYARIGSTAVIEMAAAAGLPLAANRLDPSHTTTWGVGMIIRHAIEHGAKKIILGLGGSATNDGGCGCAAALGIRFLDFENREFRPVGATLEQIASIDCTAVERLFRDIEVEVMCDIDNPLCGPRGAAVVFGPQKGADGAMITKLDQGLSHLAQKIYSQLGKKVADIPGAGAAGGFGAGAAAFFNASLRPGIEIVLDMVNFDQQLQGCDLVITGEGCIDGQSLGGKVPVGVAHRARHFNVPVIVIAGMIGDDAYSVYKEGITAVFNTNRAGLSFDQLINRSEEDYRRTIEDIFRYTKALTGK